MPVYFRLSAGVLILSGVRNRSRCPATVVLAHYAIRSLAGMGSAARYSTGLTCGQCAAVSFYAQYIGVAGLAPDRGIEPLRRSGSLLAPVLVREMPNYSRQSAIDEIPAFGTLARSAFTIIGAWGRSFRTSYAIRLLHYYGFCRNALARGVHGGMVCLVGVEPTEELLLRQMRLPIPPQVHKRHGRRGSPPRRTQEIPPAQRRHAK